MADVQVTCITKPHPQSPHEHITELGNPRAGWKWSRDQVIASIDAKANTFFVVDPYTGKRSNVGVVRPADRPLMSGHTRTVTGTTIYCPSIVARSD